MVPRRPGHIASKATASPGDCQRWATSPAELCRRRREVIEYPSALQWSLHVGQVGPDALELRVQKRGLLTTAAIGSCLKVVVAAIIDKDASLSLREHTKGVFLERSKPSHRQCRTGDCSPSL